MPVKTVTADLSRRADQEKPRLYTAAYNLTRYGADARMIRGIVSQAIADANRAQKKDGF